MINTTRHNPMESGRISKCLFGNGYVSFSMLGLPTFYFYVKDHLGNVREVVTEDGTDVQVTHYYPFGGVIGDISTGPAVQRFKYNGKEFDRENGLDWYDYGARPYAPDVPRFIKQDMMAEAVYNQSSYMYANSNPVYYIDLFGLKGVSPEDAEEGWHSFDTINDWIELPNVTITASAENNDWGIDSTASKWTPGLPSTGDFLSVSGWANSLGEFVFNKKTTAQKSKIVYDTKKAIKKKTGIAIRVSNSELYRTVIPNTFVKIGKKLTNASFIATMVENGYDISNNNCVSYGNIIDCTMAGMPYVPIVGPYIAVTYVGLDIVLTLSTGKGNRYYINQWYNNTIGTSSIYDF